MREKFITKDNPVAVWLEFLRNPFSQEVIEAEEIIPELKEAKDIFKRVNSNPRDRELWKMREQTMMEEASALNNARREGMKEGIEKGKLETARNLLKMGLTHGQIAEATGLPIEEINQLKDL